MKRFNLSKPAAAGDSSEEPVSEAKAAPPSGIRLLLLILLLVVAVAIAARNFIGKDFGQKIAAPLSGLRTNQTPSAGPTSPASPAPTTPGVSAIAPTTAKKLDSGESPASQGDPTSPLKKSGEPDLFLARPIALEDVGGARKAKIAPQERFRVQVGAMRIEENANALKRRLEKLGYPSAIEREHGSVNQHVVLVSAPNDKSESDALVERLKGEGLSAIVTGSDAGYHVEVGRTLSLDEAIDTAREIQKKGYIPKIVSEKVTTTLHLVRVGEFTTRGEAREKSRELRRKGFPTIITKD